MKLLYTTSIFTKLLEKYKQKKFEKLIRNIIKNGTNFYNLFSMLISFCLFASLTICQTFSIYNKMTRHVFFYNSMSNNTEYMKLVYVHNILNIYIFLRTHTRHKIFFLSRSSFHLQLLSNSNF